MRGSERRSLLDGELSRRRLAAQSFIDRYLDRLVDIFDFPLAPPSHGVGSLPASSSSARKYAASTSGDAYMTMDGSISPRARSRECTIGGSFSKPRKVSLVDRVREVLLRSTKPGSKTRTRNSVAICGSSMKSNNAPDVRMSWLSEKSKAKEPQDDLWVEHEEQDRQLECGYQCLADEATM